MGQKKKDKESEIYSSFNAIRIQVILILYVESIYNQISR
jgi:hypothetical protein